MEWVPVVLVAVGAGGSLWALAALARRIRRRGAAGQALAAAMAAYDEGFRATAHDTFVELRALDERGQQAPAPGGPPQG